MKIFRCVYWLAVLFLLFAQTGYCDSLWSASDGSTPDALVTDHRANKVGDIITVLIIDSSSVSQKTTSSRNRASAINLEVTNWTQPKFYHGLRSSVNSTTKGNMPIYGMDGAATYSGGGTYSGSYNIQTQVTTKIIEVLPNKNMVIEGLSEVMVNTEKNTVAVSGVIRPEDISPNNTILSTQVADAKVRLLGKGPIQNKTKAGVFEKILDFIWPF